MLCYFDNMRLKKHLHQNSVQVFLEFYNLLNTIVDKSSLSHEIAEESKSALSDDFKEKQNEIMKIK